MFTMKLIVCIALCVISHGVHAENMENMVSVMEPMPEYEEMVRNIQESSMGEPDPNVGRRVKNMKKSDNAEEMGSYFQGDMLIPMSRMKFDPNAARETRWPGAIVPYELDQRFTANERSLIHYGMRLLEKYTCVRFEPLRSGTESYVAFERKQDGCWSALGRTGGRQIINLQPNGCFSPGTVIHEIMHALGLPHEQSRQDRDQHVRIIWNNIRRGEEPQFAVHRGYTGVDFAYDYVSVMHYGLHAFSKNGQNTIEPISSVGRANADKIGNRRGPTSIDVKKINRIYGCQTSNTVGTTSTSNTGRRTRYRPQGANRNFYRYNYNGYRPFRHENEIGDY